MKVIGIDNTGYKVSLIHRIDNNAIGVEELPKGIFHLTEPIEINLDEKKQLAK